MSPHVLLSTDRVFVTFSTPTEWRLGGAAGSWWLDAFWDPGHAPFPAREARDPSLYVRACGVELTWWF